MKFKKISTGELAEETMSAVGVFLFGPFYFLFTGLILYAFVWFFVIACIVLYTKSYYVIPMVLNLIVALKSESIIRNHYLNSGWIEVDNQGEPLDFESRLKICPFCSEQIKFSARKCKHCGSDLTDIDNVKRI